MRYVVQIKKKDPTKAGKWALAFSKIERCLLYVSLRVFKVSKFREKLVAFVHIWLLSVLELGQWASTSSLLVCTVSTRLVSARSCVLTTRRFSWFQRGQRSPSSSFSMLGQWRRQRRASPMRAFFFPHFLLRSVTVVGHWRRCVRFIASLKTLSFKWQMIQVKTVNDGGQSLTKVYEV